MTPQRRGPWSQEEDNFLMELVDLHGAQSWVTISTTLGTRSAKQCRERYHQNLKPSLNHNPITPEEGELIEALVEEFGKRWAEIARRLNGRSDNAVKNWWNGSQNRRKRLDKRRNMQGLDEHHPRQQPMRPALSLPLPQPQILGDANYPRYHHYDGLPSPSASISPTTASSPRTESVYSYTHSPKPSFSASSDVSPWSRPRSSIAPSSSHFSHSDFSLPPLRTAEGRPLLPPLSSLASLCPASPGSGPPSSRPHSSMSAIHSQLPTAPSSPTTTPSRHSICLGSRQLEDKDHKMQLHHLLNPQPQSQEQPPHESV